MIQISATALQEGCERAHDVFQLNRLRSHDEAASGFDALYRALGLDDDMRDALQTALLELVPVRGLPATDLTAAAAMSAGVLVGLLIADSALPAEELDLPVLPSP